MTLNDFTAAGFYYNRGEELLKVGDVIEGIDQKHYKVIMTPQNEVWVEEGETHELKDPKSLGMDFFNSCYPPTDLALVPQFTY